MTKERRDEIMHDFLDEMCTVFERAIGRELTEEDEEIGTPWYKFAMKALEFVPELTARYEPGENINV